MKSQKIFANLVKVKEVKESQLDAKKLINNKVSMVTFLLLSRCFLYILLFTIIFTSYDNKMSLSKSPRFFSAY